MLYGGFPGNCRRSDADRATFGIDIITGLVSEVTGRNVVIAVDYARLFDADGDEGEVVSADAPGISGGPVYRITERADLEIAGFICEQAAENNFVLARHADAIAANGQIVGS